MSDRKKRHLRRRFGAGALAAVLALGLIGPAAPPSHGKFPVVDIEAIIARIKATRERYKQWLEEQEWFKGKQELDAELAANEANVVNNAMANVAARDTHTQAVKHRAEVMERARPDRDICENLEASDTIAEAEEAVVEGRWLEEAVEGEDETAQMAMDVREGYKAMRTKETRDEQVALQREVARNIMETCLGEDADSEEYQCVGTEILLTGGDEGTLPKEGVAMGRRQVALITSPVPAETTPDTYRDSDVALRSHVRDLRRAAIMNLAVSSFEQVLSQYSGTDDQPSMVASLEDFAAKRFGGESEDFLKALANADKSNSGDDIMPAEVLRKLATMQAFSLRMSVMQYRQSLRMQALEAAHLSLLLNPVGGGRS